MYPAKLHRSLDQTVDLAQLLKRWILQNQLKLVNNLTKSSDKKQLEIWNRIVPNKPMGFSLDCCR